MAELTAMTADQARVTRVRESSTTMPTWSIRWIVMRSMVGTRPEPVGELSRGTGPRRRSGAEAALAGKKGDNLSKRPRILQHKQVPALVALQLAAGDP